MTLPEELLRRFDPTVLEQDRACIAVLGPDRVIVWVNPAWKTFATDNGGGTGLEVGARYFDAVQGTLRTWFEERMLECQRTGEPFELEYECSSPETFRTYHLRALPIGGFLLMAHSLRTEQPHSRTPMPPFEVVYRAANGLTLQCSNCRRFKRVDTGAWDWVPDWVRTQPDRTSHGICGVCAGFYYGDLLLADAKNA